MNPPLRNPTVLFCPGDYGLWAYDVASGRFHRLNAIASLIAELCDGRRALAEIQRLVEPLLPIGSRGDVGLCIEQGLEAELLKTGQPANAEIDPVSLARRLKSEGKMEAAYVCQFNAAEREPEQPHHWALLGELARVLGRRSDAKNAYERYLALSPHNAEIRHLLTALGDEPPPPRAGDDVIEQLYARFAGFYESNMLGQLDYQAPKHISKLVADLIPDRQHLSGLDLGCGSGLAGLELRSRCANLSGIDLSPDMLDLARKRGIYDRLDVAEITLWLKGCTESFDLIVACDSLIYFGDLRQAILLAARLLEPGGLLVFTLESGERHPFHLTASGRYTHHPDHVREVAAEGGLDVLHLEPAFLRMEYGEKVIGLLVALGKGSRSSRSPSW